MLRFMKILLHEKSLNFFLNLFKFLKIFLKIFHTSHIYCNMNMANRGF